MTALGQFDSRLFTFTIIPYALKNTLSGIILWSIPTEKPRYQRNKILVHPSSTLVKQSVKLNYQVVLIHIIITIDHKLSVLRHQKIKPEEKMEGECANVERPDSIYNRSN